jgi:hypothetical protein
MNADWEKIERDIVALKSAIAARRGELEQLSIPEIESLLTAARGCMVELIVFRTSLEKAKERCADLHSPFDSQV